MFSGLSLEPFLQILLAAFLGALVGFEREQKKKEAGFRTFALVSLGACFFTLSASYFSAAGLENTALLAIDPSRVVQAVAIGIGFIGSGLIIQRKAQIEGLTTAAALWATAAFGIGVGLKLYLLSIFACVMVVAVLAVFEIIEHKVFRKKA